MAFGIARKGGIFGWERSTSRERGRTITASIDGVPVLTYLTNAGDAPKQTVQLAVGNSSREVMDGWLV